MKTSFRYFRLFPFLIFFCKLFIKFVKKAFNPQKKYYYIMYPEKYDLEQIAKLAMREKGLKPDYSPEVFHQLETINTPALKNESYKDLRILPWCSIDNEDSRDLDQLTCVNKQNGNFELFIAIADVDALVKKNSPIDLHASINTTSVYTPAKIFSMLPEKLSTDLTSLNEETDRLAMIVKVNVNNTGEILGGSISKGIVRNQAKLTYDEVGQWLEGKKGPPEKIKAVMNLQKNLEWQHEVAQLMKNKRHSSGALTLETAEISAKMSNHQEFFLQVASHSFSNELIENFMIAANSIAVKQFQSFNVPSLRRVVRIPKKWDRIVEIAKSYGDLLPQDPDPKALENFLIKRKKLDPVSFPELSITVIKLLGRGEYVVEIPGGPVIGHFGLALSEYAHTTAPNRRYPDLITQRQIKAHLDKNKNPYSIEDLQIIAEHCTKQEDAAMKVERQMNKVAAAIILSSRIGTVFDGLITGASEKGTWVKISNPPIEGKIVEGFEGLDVGDKVKVKLISVDIPRGHINFSRM